MVNTYYTLQKYLPVIGEFDLVIVELGLVTLAVVLIGSLSVFGLPKTMRFNG